MYSKLDPELSVTDEVQSIQWHVDAQRGRPKTRSWSAGLIVEAQGNTGGSKILCELQRDHAVDGALVDEEVFLQPLQRVGLGRGKRRLSDVQSVERLDLKQHGRVS